MNSAPSREAGHVFVTVADITHLQVDAWLLPTDQRLSIRSQWGVTSDQAAELRRDPALDDFLSGLVFAAQWPRHEGGPLPILTAVPLAGAKSLADLRPRLIEGLEVAAEAAHARRKDGRIPLIATPAFGVGGGGADEKRGEVIDGILNAAEDVARGSGVDVVVCLWNRVDYALAQHTRQEQWRNTAPLNAERWAKVQELARHARNGDLVPFMGAGVSATAGLPSWSRLLEDLRAGVPPIPDEALRGLGELDKASVIESKYKDPAAFSQKLGALVRSKHFGLAPSLLANLPGTSAVTLNYDRLYEAAWQDAWHDDEKKLRVLPWDALAPSEPWLLKLHGDMDHPESIILTRSQYLDFAVKQRGLASLAKALLMTKHLLFVGFGMSDDHFHEIVHEVRGIRPMTSTSDAAPVHTGTALVLGNGVVYDAVWGKDFAILPFTPKGETTNVEAAGRSLEIFLDVMVCLSGSDEPFTLDPRFRGVVEPRALEAATHLASLQADFEHKGLRDTGPGRRLEQLLLDLGHGGHT